MRKTKLSRKELARQRQKDRAAGVAREFQFRPDRSKPVPKSERHDAKPGETDLRNIKVAVHIKLDADIVDHFKKRATEPNAAPYQTQINAELRGIVERSVGTNLRQEVAERALSPLAETFDRVRPSIVALASRLASSATAMPVFPEILGTGFVVDQRGIVMTNRHVAVALQRLPANCAMAIIFPPVESKETEHGQPVIFRAVKSYNVIESFQSSGPFYGDLLPDIALLLIDVQGLQPLQFNTSRNVIRIGADVATAGFAMGTNPLVSQHKVRQLTPFLRHGIISSVHPFPSPHPHGFTIDIMTQGGESGSPVFLPGSAHVVGMVYAGIDYTNVTIAIPASLLEPALHQALENGTIDLSNTPTVTQILSEMERTEVMQWEPIQFRRKR